MKKRITAIIMALVMVMALLPTTVFAANPIEFKVTADKTTAEPGDTISYTVTMGAATDLVSLKIKLDIPAGLTYVAGSGTVASGVKGTLKATSVEFTESSRVFMADPSYTGTAVITLFTFKCTVNAEAKGALTVGLIIDDDNIFDSNADNIPFTKTGATVNVPVRATGIKLNKTALSLSLNGTKEETLFATVEPSDTTDTVTWTSSNTKVATVVNGKVTAVGAGTAVITVRAGNQTATCTVNVSACDHVFTAETVKAEALKTAGDCLNKAVYYKSCAKCGAVSSNDSDTFEGAFGSHKMTKHEATVATCAKEGNPEYWSCSVCKKNYDSATGGTEVTNIVIQKDPANHVGSYKYEVNKTDATKHDKICTGCDTVVETVAHSGGTPTCTKKAVCSDCKAEYGELAKHKLTKTDKVDSTCTATGHQAYWTCSECKGIFADEQGTTATTLDKLTIAKKAHTPGDYVTNATEHFKTCSVCGIEIKDSRAKHTFVKDEATGVETCSVCGYAIGGKVDENHQHAAGNDWFRDENNHWHKCTDPKCTAHVDEAKHDFETVSTTKDGNKTTTVEKCKTCGYVKTTTVDNTPVTPVNPSKPGRPSGTKTVQSGKTFDAGVGVYVGLSILSLTGSAVVIGKKRKTR